MLPIISILLWISFFTQVTIASPAAGDEGDHTLSPRHPGALAIDGPYKVATNPQTSTTNDQDGSPIAPRAVVNTRRASATATSKSAADASLGQRIDGLTTIVVAGTLVWTFAM